MVQIAICRNEDYGNNGVMTLLWLVEVMMCVRMYVYVLPCVDCVNESRENGTRCSGTDFHLYSK